MKELEENTRLERFLWFRNSFLSRAGKAIAYPLHLIISSMRVFSTILREHLPLVAIVGIYIVAGYAVQGVFSIEKMMLLKPS